MLGRLWWTLSKRYRDSNWFLILFQLAKISSEMAGLVTLKNRRKDSRSTSSSAMRQPTAVASMPSSAPSQAPSIPAPKKRGPSKTKEKMPISASLYGGPSSGFGGGMPPSAASSVSSSKPSKSHQQPTPLPQAMPTAVQPVASHAQAKRHRGGSTASGGAAK